jgi:hypothetical protein
VLPEMAFFMPASMRSHCQPAFLVGVNGLLHDPAGSFCLVERHNSTTPKTVRTAVLEPEFHRRSSRTSRCRPVAARRSLAMAVLWREYGQQV